jgi:fructose-1,6-bisphosphatase/inositol monophosphatase family enzyme
VTENDMHLETFLVDRLADIASFIRDNRRRAVRSTKETFGTDENDELNSVVTSFDIFAQDFIGSSLIRIRPAIKIYGEEDGLVACASDLAGGGLILVVDPIDGTKWFASGSADYSCLATLTENGIPKLAIGIFPESLRGYSCNGGCVRKFSVKEGKVIFEPDVTPPGSGGGIACHYRLTNREFIDRFRAVADRFGELKFNGHGFGTNLTFVEHAFEGRYSAFIAPKMGIVDGFPTAFFLKSIGWTVRFFDARSMTGNWKDADPWSYTDLGKLGKLRSRYIAAATPERLSAVLEAINSSA